MLNKNILTIEDKRIYSMRNPCLKYRKSLRELSINISSSRIFLDIFTFMQIDPAELVARHKRVDDEIKLLS